MTLGPTHQRPKRGAYLLSISTWASLIHQARERTLGCVANKQAYRNAYIFLATDKNGVGGAGKLGYIGIVGYDHNKSGSHKGEGAERNIHIWLPRAQVLL